MYINYFIFSPHTYYGGVIMGEFLSSQAGIGYLILYGTQVFNLNLVMTGITLLLILSYLLYLIINTLEKHALRHM